MIDLAKITTHLTPQQQAILLTFPANETPHSIPNLDPILQQNLWSLTRLSWSPSPHIQITCCLVQAHWGIGEPEIKWNLTSLGCQIHKELINGQKETSHQSSQLHSQCTDNNSSDCGGGVGAGIDK